MKSKIYFRLIVLSMFVFVTIVSCVKKEKTIEDYDVKEVINLAINDFDNRVLQSDCDYLSTIDVNKRFVDKELSIIIDKRLMYDKETSNTHIYKNNMITYDDIKLDYDQEEYRVIEDANIVYYQKNVKNEIVFPWEKYVISKLLDDKNNIVLHLFGLINEKDFVIEKLNKDSSNNNVLTIKGKLNSIEFLENLSTEFINSKTSFLDDIDFDVTVAINEIDSGYRYKSIELNSIDENLNLKFNITASFEVKDLEVFLPEEIIKCMDKEISYEEYLQSALIDTEDENEIYDKLYSFTNEFYSLYDKEHFITGEKAKELGQKYLKSKQGKFYDVRDKIFSMDSYWDEKAKVFGLNKDEELKNIKNLFSGQYSGKKAIERYKKDPSSFAFNTQVENGLYKLGIYSDLSLDAEDKYGFSIFERNYECISIYTNSIGIKAYEFRAKDDRNDTYRYIKFIEDEHYYNEYKNEVLIIKLSDIQGEHYFDDKDAFHFYIFEKENAYEYADQYIIDFMFDMYQSQYYDILLNKVEEVLDNY